MQQTSESGPEWGQDMCWTRSRAAQRGAASISSTTIGPSDLSMDRSDRHFTSDSGATVTLTARAFAKMAEFAAKRSQRETGGILIGHYSEDLTIARIEAASDEPPDSRAGRTWFVRGQVGLAEILQRAWREGRYYLGEWHSHPGASPAPSGPDLSAIAKMARHPTFICHRPILVIIGGNFHQQPLLSATLAAKTGVTTQLRAELYSNEHERLLR